MTRRSLEVLEVDKILAGWGIDGLIAQRYLGWSKGSPLLMGDTNSPCGFWWHPPEGNATSLPPKVSEDMNLTWDVVDAIFALGWKFGMTQNSDKQVVIAFVPMGQGYEPSDAIKVYVPSVKLAPLGVCRAALLLSAELVARAAEQEARDESKLAVM
jgi:hypothetical protein